MAKTHRCTAVQRIVGQQRFRSVCSCGWRSGITTNEAAAVRAWDRSHTVPNDDTKDSSYEPRITEVDG